MAKEINKNTDQIRPLFSWLWLGVLAFLTFMFACMFGGLAGYALEYEMVPPVIAIMLMFIGLALFISAIVMFLFAKKNIIAEANVRALEVFHGKCRAAN